MDVYVVVENPDAYDGRGVEATHVFRSESAARAYIERSMASKPYEYKSDLSPDQGDDRVQRAGVTWTNGQGERHYTVTRLTLED